MILEDGQLATRSARFLLNAIANDEHGMVQGLGAAILAHHAAIVELPRLGIDGNRDGS